MIFRFAAFLFVVFFFAGFPFAVLLFAIVVSSRKGHSWNLQLRIVYLENDVSKLLHDGEYGLSASIYRMNAEHGALKTADAGKKPVRA